MHCVFINFTCKIYSSNHKIKYFFLTFLSFTLFIAWENHQRVAVVEYFSLSRSGVQEFQGPVGKALLINSLVRVEVDRRLAGSAGLRVVHTPLGTFYRGRKIRAE